MSQRYAIPAFFLLAAALPCPAAQPVVGAKEFENAPFVKCLPIEAAIGGEIGARDPQYVRNAFLEDNGNSMRKALGEYGEYYEKGRRTDEIAGSILKATDSAVEIAVESVPVLGKMVEVGFEGLEETFKSETAESRRRLLASQISAFQHDYPAEALTPDNLKRRIGDLIGPSSVFKDTPKSEYDLLQDAAIKDITDVLAKIMQTQALQGQAILDLQNAYLKQVQAMAKIRVGQARASAQATASLRAIQEAASRTGNGRADIDNIDAKSEYRARAEGFSRAMAVAGDQFQEASTLFRNLGNEKLARAANKVAGVANLAAGIAAASYNPAAILPAINGAMSLFGMGASGPSEIESAKQEILKAIRELSWKIDRYQADVMGKLQAVEINEQVNTRILEDLQSGALDLCHNVIPDGPDGWFMGARNEERRQRLDKVVRFTRYEDLLQNFGNHGGDVWKCLHDPTGLIGHFPKDQKLTMLWVMKATDLVVREAQPQTGDEGKAAANAPAALALPELPQSKSEQRAAPLNKFTMRSLRITRNFVEPYLAQAAIRWFAMPVRRFDDMTWKLSAIDRKDSIDSEAVRKSQELSGFSSDYFVWNFFDETLNPDRVVKYGGYLVATHFYYQLLTQERPAPPSLSVLLADRSQNVLGQERLYRALTIVNLGIAQQALLSGDALLPILYAVESGQRDALSSSWPGFGGVLKPEAVKKDDDWNAIRHKSEELIKLDPLLAQNLLLFILRSEVLEPQRSQYAVALASAERFHDPFQLRALTAARWDFRYSEKEDKEHGVPKGLYLHLHDIEVPVPTLAEFSAGIFYQTPAMAELLQLRERIVDELAGYSFAEKGVLTSQQMRDMKKLMLTSLGSSNGTGAIESAKHQTTAEH
jgi:hypothetical protein